MSTPWDSNLIIIPQGFPCPEPVRRFTHVVRASYVPHECGASAANRAGSRPGAEEASDTKLDTNRHEIGTK